MQLFLDTADYQSIKKLYETGIVDGITTNPTNLRKDGANPKEAIKKICELMPGKPVSVQVTESDLDAIYAQAQEIATISDNVVVKIPCYQPYYPVIQKLLGQNVPLNITLVFSLPQALAMCKLGATYISPFLGRWDDIDADTSALLAEIVDMKNEYDFGTKVLAASLRDVPSVHQAINAGSDVATISPALFEKMLKHPLTEQGMEKFSQDWNKLGISQFP
ncbi:fructose-6-phosphate aldolase [bacterium]|jgi:transaldolase|nr:fructose-6-phosphate aldolase [bacterium]MBT3903400.1 fructose-6-phosphate aldolase [bacterium]MBT4577595.1 fructose-6-phosphate aldolase [bacterium]MBT5345755.1 fructose-6-phosphate aldolase [bacterium]MBT6130904.1 fructose-6-phosphate aldolase [bacterium]